ncbi:MAG: hypothetical protein BWY30_00240 [Tenericutes bacterium ADurb.Bin239]|jgi:hypothetical protein|nr:MAG: hypothetical protein BWY30_00240 [Tenericutes bacterium ADurb.Bin239]
MKKIKRIALLVGVLTITGCKAVTEIFEKGSFYTSVFSENYYREIPQRYLSDDYAETVYAIDDQININQPLDNAFENAIKHDLISKNISLEKVIELYGSDATKAIKASDYTNEIEYMEAVFGSLGSAENAKANWINYANNNNLSKGNYSKSIRESFKRGIFSKLTDGNIKCDGNGPKARIQIDERGMGHTFDHELINYQRFIISARGGSTVNYGNYGVARVTKAKVRVNVSFFIEKSTTNAASKHTVTFVVPEMHSDNEAILFSTIISFDLSEILGAETLKRVNGITINYELLEHAFLKPGGVLDESLDEEFALMVYEVMLPYSSWH